MIHRASERGQASMGWFQAAYSFSFGRYYNPNRMGFGALRVLNDSVIQAGTGFPRHPHDNMEIVTIQFAGDLEHTDSTAKRHIRANDVQSITAGTGVWHEDVNVATEPAQQLQIWVEPRAQGLVPASDIKHFDPQNREERWQVLVSPDRAEDSLVIQQDAWFSRGVFANGQPVTYQWHKPGSGLYLFVVSGSVQIDKQTVGSRDALLVTNQNQVSFQPEQPADLLAIEVPM
jgi:hypothetical protein